MKAGAQRICGKTADAKPAAPTFLCTHPFGHGGPHSWDRPQDREDKAWPPKNLEGKGGGRGGVPGPT